MAGVDVPTFPSPDMYVFSDYSGTHKGSRFQTYSFLVLDLYESPQWELHRRSVRQEHLPHNRRLSFKRLGDKHRQAAIVPLLQAANNIRGCIFTFAIDSEVRNLMHGEHFRRFMNEQLSGDKGWATASIEMRLRICTFGLLLIGGLAAPKQNVFWISDQDEILANERQSQYMAELLGRLGNLYLPQDLGEQSFGSTAIDEVDRAIEDLAALPDLAAGALAELCASQIDHLRSSVASVFETPEGISNKARALCNWYLDDSYRLRRAVFAITVQPDGKFAVRQVGLGEMPR